MKFNNDGKFGIKIKFTNKLGPKQFFDTVLFGLVVGLIIVFMIGFFIGYKRVVVMCSMNPTLIEGDNIFVEKTTMFFNAPKRGDIMVFPLPYKNISNDPLAVFKRLTGFHCHDLTVIKRIVGLPGDKIIIKPDENNRSTVYINGKKLNEKYILTNPNNIMSHMVYGPYVVPKNSYFMLGDNRDDSTDSRDWGFVKRDRFLGKAAFVFYPFNRIKRL